ncbi:hypothetical protein M8J76_009076 [Diaphorina citri]|nr:hypothetical protein M8J76_009076 [Diaphorina citri]
MKCTIPEISWHNRDPVLSVDIQLKQEKDNCYRIVTGGADSHVFIWYLTERESGIANVEFASDLSRHQKAVNVVRFSPNGELLASGDDESTIIVWKQKTDQDLPEFPSSNLDEENVNKEHWIVTKILRGHLEDVYDISWSPTSTHLISGSVDNTAIMWDVHKGKNLGILTEHKKFVQGVAWDPKNQYVATLSSDRSLRTYSIQSKKVISRACRSKLPVDSSHELFDKVVPLFHDDTMKSFFRRLTFSPDGQLLIAPSGCLENSDSTRKPISVTHVFTRACLNKPAVCLPSLQYYSVAVKCCPVLFELKPSDDKPLFKLPYRIVIAVATENNILLYDTQHASPFAFIANIHYTKLTDITWSSDGKVLIASSTDGYCSIISFGDNEIGIPYVPPSGEESKENDPTKGEPVRSEDKPKSAEQAKSEGKVLGEKQSGNKTSPTDKSSEDTQKISVKNEKESNSEAVEAVTSDIKESKDNNAPAEAMEVDPVPPETNAECPSTPKTHGGTPNKGGTPSKTPRRVQLITLSSPNRKRKQDEKIRETIKENDAKKACLDEKEGGKKSEDEKEEGQIGEKKGEDKKEEITIPNENKMENPEDKMGEKKINVKEEITPNPNDNKENPDRQIDQRSSEKEANTASSPGNKTVDFDLILENTSDSILNPSFVEESPKSSKASGAKSADFSESFARENSAISDKKDESKSFPGGNSALTSPCREKDTGEKHVFTPPRVVQSPKQITPGRRVQLITLSSPKVKPKTQDK